VRTKETGARICYGVYQGDGKTLLVLPSRALAQRELLAGASGGGHEATLKVLRTTAERDAARRMLRRFRNVPYFRAWFLAGADLPPDVNLASDSDIKAATKAWDFGAVMREILQPGQRSHYDSWFSDGSFPPEQTAEFVGWHYGAPGPETWLIVPEWVVKMRDELTPNAICDAARISRSTFKRWQRDATCRQALVDAIAEAEAGRNVPKNSAAWDRLFGDDAGWQERYASRVRQSDVARSMLAEGKRIVDVATELGISKSSAQRIGAGEFGQGRDRFGAEKVKSNMLRFAEHATRNKALERVRNIEGNPFDAPVTLSPLRCRARELGLLDAFDGWLLEAIREIGDAPSTAKQGKLRGCWGRRGVVMKGARMWVPKSPLAWKFRDKARARPATSELMDATPCAVLWFLDCVLPAPPRGKASAYRKAVGLVARSRRSVVRTSGTMAAAPAIAAESKGEAHANSSAAGLLPPAAEAMLEHNRRRKRGRPVDAAKQERNRRIVEAWQTGEYKNFADLGNAFGQMPRGTVKNIVDKATRKKRRAH